MGLRAGLGMGPRAPDFDVNPGIKNNDRFFQGSRRLWKSVRKQTRNAIRYRVSPPPVLCWGCARVARSFSRPCALPDLRTWTGRYRSPLCCIGKHRRSRTPSPKVWSCA